MFYTTLKTVLICSKSLFLYKIGLVDYFNSFKTTLTELSKLNIFYTKIIQWIADHNFNDEKLTDFLKNFTNNVYYTKEDIDYESLIELYNHAEQNGDTFSLSGLTPINAGTISLVFKGTLNGKPIVIKMLRRNIKDKLHDAINLFNYIGKIITFIPYLEKIGVSRIIEKNTNLLIKQIDFNNEINNMNIFTKKYKKNNTIKIPLVYKYYTEKNSNLIVMEYFDGKTMYELEAKERELYYKTLAKIAMMNYFKYGLIHGDLHSGNIIFLPDNVIGYLDLGIIYKLKPEQQNLLYTFFSNFTKKNYTNLIDELIDEYNIDTCFIINFSKDKLTSTISIIKKELIQKLENKELLNGSISQKDIFIIINTLYKHKMEFNDYVSFMFLSSVSCLSMCSKLSNNNMTELLTQAFNEFDSQLKFD